MCQALQAAHDVTRNFIAQYPGCFTPIVINITDGIATDGDPEPVAAGLSGLTSQDGNVLLMNIHISPEGSSPILLPASDAELTDDYARRLFRMSSPLPGEMLENAHTLDSSVGVGARGVPLTQT